MIDYESSIFDKKTIRAIDNGTFRIAHEEFSLSDWAADLYDFFLQRSRTHNFTFKSEFGEIYDNSLVGDSECLSKTMKAIFELASVVIPHNRTVLFRVEQLSDFAADYTFLRLLLRASGEKVRKDALDVIVLPSPIVAGEDAAHLLSLTKKLLGMMHGSLTLQVRENKDVTFTVAIPLYRHVYMNHEIEDKNNLDVWGKVGLEKIRILLGTDDKLDNNIIHSVMDSFGVRIDTAVDGGEVIGKFLALPPHTYDCILMDIRMKNVDGLEASRKIRDSSHPQAEDIPILGMAESSFAEEVAAAFESGMNDCLRKPLNFKLLLQFLVCLASAKR